MITMKIEKITLPIADQDFIRSLCIHGSLIYINGEHRVLGHISFSDYEIKWCLPFPDDQHHIHAFEYIGFSKEYIKNIGPVYKFLVNPKIGVKGAASIFVFPISIILFPNQMRDFRLWEPEYEKTGYGEDLNSLFT